MEKIQENMRKQTYVFVQENYIKACLLVFSPFSAHFYPHYIIMVKGPLLPKH